MAPSVDPPHPLSTRSAVTVRPGRTVTRRGEMTQLLCTILSLFQLALFGRAILSWFPLRHGSAMAQVAALLARVTEPVLAPVRRALPFLRATGIDLSFLVVLLLVGVVQRSLGCGAGLL